MLAFFLKKNNINIKVSPEKWDMCGKGAVGMNSPCFQGQG